MPYPDIILTKPLRRTIMLCLMAVFFVSAPLIIGYTAGYRYDVGSREIKQTGVISIDVEPADATVTIGNVVIKKKMPLRLPNRAPGTYHLTITKPGYQSWEKDITVESKQTVYIRDVTLFREATPQPFLTERTDISGLATSFDGSYVLITTRQADSYELILIDTKTKEKTTMDRGAWEQRPTVEWSPRHSLSVLIHPDRTIQLLDPRQKSIIQTVSVPKISSGTVFQWDTDPDILSVRVRSQTGIVRLLGSGDTVHENIPTFVSTTVWFRDNRDMWIYDEKKAGIHIVGDDHTITMPEPLNEILDINSNRIIGKNNNHIIVTHRNGGAPQILEANFARLHPFTNEWIIWSANELWTVYPDGRVVILNRTSEAIRDVHPLDQFGVLLLGTDERLIGFNPGYYISHNLLSLKNVTMLGVNQRLRQIYVLYEQDGKQNFSELTY